MKSGLEDVKAVEGVKAAEGVRTGRRGPLFTRESGMTLQRVQLSSQDSKEERQ